MLSVPPNPRSWCALVLLSALVTLPLWLLSLPAALLLGPMLAAIVLGVQGQRLAVPKPFYSLAQSLIGLMVAASISLPLLSHLLADLGLYLAVIAAVLLASSLLGWQLARGPWLPGTTGLWGIYPGAASAMVMMAESAANADVRLVALMQYLRVLLVALSASAVAHWAAPVAPEPSAPLPLDLGGLVVTLALALALSWLGRRAALPSGPFLLAMVLGALVQLAGDYQLTLPPWLLGLAYATLGWHVGLGFTRSTLKTARRALLPMLAAIGLLMALCAGIGYLLVHFLAIDPLTAYLATSPGGMDAIAIIAAGSGVDLPFVMAMQTLRFLLVLLLGPPLARFLARRLEGKTPLSGG